MGAMGTDVAIETADVALMGEDLRHLTQSPRPRKARPRIMLQNVGSSLGLITILILPLTGVLGLAAVVAARTRWKSSSSLTGRAGRTKPLGEATAAARDGVRVAAATG